MSSVFGREFDHQAMAIVRSLINRGADINKQDSQGWTALYQSAFAGNLGTRTALHASEVVFNVSIAMFDYSCLHFHKL